MAHLRKWLSLSLVRRVTSDRITFRTTFRDTPSSRQIALIALPCTKNKRRIFAIVSTISIPTSASIIMEASVDPQPRGPDWMPITPKTGSLFHAGSQLELSGNVFKLCRMGLQIK